MFVLVRTEISNKTHGLRVGKSFVRNHLAKHSALERECELSLSLSFACGSTRVSTYTKLCGLGLALGGRVGCWGAYLQVLQTLNQFGVVKRRFFPQRAFRSLQF